MKLLHGKKLMEVLNQSKHLITKDLLKTSLDNNNKPQQVGAFQPPRVKGHANKCKTWERANWLLLSSY